jgi:hypothetical protein
LRRVDAGVEVNSETRQKSFTTQAAEYGFIIDNDDMTRTYMKFSAKISDIGFQGKDGVINQDCDGKSCAISKR